MNNNLESTATLLNKVQGGDDNAREMLCSIYLPVLTRWAHGRLPEYARDLAETDDMVQATLLQALAKLDSFVPLREGSFLAYLRKIMLNNIRMEIRRHNRVSDKAQLERSVEAVATDPSVIEQTIGTETLERYEEALMMLTERSREAVILRVEFGYSFPEIATAIGCNSANAARMIVSRAVLQMAELMK